MNSTAPSGWAETRFGVSGRPEPKKRLPGERDPLRRFPKAVREAAERFRSSGDTRFLANLIDGVIEYYVDPAKRARLKAPGADRLKLTSDLGVDSLTLLEIVFLAEEVLGISIDDEQLRPLSTVGDMKQAVLAKFGSPAA
jgi:Phosphopantetheine attachment site